MASRLAVQQTSKYSLKQSFTNCWNMAGALLSPKGITVYSRFPDRVWKVVFHSSPAANIIWWYPWRREGLVYHCAFERRSSVLRIRGKGYRFLMVMALSPY